MFIQMSVNVMTNVHIMDCSPTRQYNYCSMYFADVGELQAHLNNDWTIILKNIKTMEDSHYELLQYNKRTLDKQRIEDEDPFINDQILHHQQQISRITDSLKAIEEEQKEIQDKYDSSPVSFEEILKLMGRVGARILETYQYSIDKCKSFDEELLDKHLKMKATLIKMLNQKDKINLQQIISHVINYSKAKLLNEVEQLRKIVLALENGEYQRVQGVYQFKQKPSASPEKKSVIAALSLEKKKVSVEKAKISSVGRDERVSPVWQQLKAQEKLKKQKQKVALRLIHGLYSTMDLARQQIIEDMCSNEKEKSKRLYNEIFSRNKFNYDQIVAFQARKEQFQEKVRMFKERMELQSKRLTEVLRKPSVKREKRKVDNLNFSKMEIDHSQDQKKDEAGLPSSRKSGSNRYRIQSPKSKPKANEYPIIIQASQENFNHIKFESNTQSTYLRPIKNKLPFLYHQNVSQAVTRAASFDQRAELNRSKAVRHQISEMKMESGDVLNQEAMARSDKLKKEEKYFCQRAKVPLKNIEVRVDGVMRQEASPPGRETRIKPNPIEYTFYVRRNNRFYEPNHNIIL